MNHSNDKNPLSLDTIDQPIAIYEPLSNTLVPKLRNDSARPRKLREIARHLQNL